VTAVALGWLLRRRVGGMDTGRIRSSLLRMHVAAVPGTIVALGGTLGLGAYLLCARLLRISEISDLTSLLRARLHGPTGSHGRSGPHGRTG
jgi:hypothetical protein